MKNTELLVFFKKMRYKKLNAARTEFVEIAI